MTSKHYAAYCRQQLWKRRRDTLLATAAPFAGAFVGLMFGLALFPHGAQAVAIMQVAAIAGAIAVVPMVGAIIATVKAR